MNLTLNDLDQAFNNVWQHKNQIPALLDTWQTLVIEFLDNIDASSPNRDQVAERIYYWEAVLAHYQHQFNGEFSSTTVH